MFVPVANAVWGHYRKHKLQLVLVWFGLTLGISLLVGVLAINYQARLSYTQNAQMLNNPFPYYVVNKQLGKRVEDATYIAMRREGFSQCVPLERTIVSSEGHVLEILGLDPVALLNMPSVNTAQFNPAELIQSPYPILISHSYASFLQIESGQYLVTNRGEIGPFQIVSDNLLGGARLITDISMVKSLNHARGLSAVACGEMTDEQLARLNAFLPDYLRFEIRTGDKLAPLTRAFHSNLLAMGLLAFVVGMFIFFQAMSLSFTQRQPLIGQLRQLGVAGRQIFAVLTVEVMTWLVIAVISGNIFGLFLANQLMPSVANTLSDLYGALVQSRVEWHWQWGVSSIGVAFVGTICACGWPMVRLLRTPPARLSRQLSLHRFSGKEFRWQALMSIALALVALVVYQQPATEASGFVLIGLTLLSAALIMPYLIWLLFSSLALLLPSPKLRWFFTDAAASLSYRGVASMAFMLAIAANIGMDTMVGSFREATSDWLKARIVADIYVRPNPSQAEEISRWLRQQNGVQDVWWQWVTETNSEQGVLQAISVGTSRAEREAITMKVSAPDFWFEFHSGRSVLVSESLALKWDWKPGQTVHLPAPFEGLWHIAGIYYDYGNPYGQVMLPHKRWQETYGAQGRVGLAILLSDDRVSHPITQSLKARFNLNDGQTINQHALLEQAMKVFEHTFKVTDALGALTLIIAVTGLFFATTAGELSRAKQFSLLRCMGMSGKELVLLGGGQLLVIGLLTAIIALPLGITLAYLLIERILMHSFGWTMDLILFPLQYGFILGISLLSLLLAGGWPVVRLVRRSAIRSFREAQ
ncbi:ABC transporter permease [Thaumasiovibrio subtropicus]|uniref:ABC transporter permease n=1 Tax=Thaumasiovibrio subtropicus TaxID=1891207 RepID=UPI000B34D106|nr:FtsX-like permease family protein [Thaumasiovibrio subtropicus]